MADGSIVLGAETGALRVLLTTGADFRTTLYLLDGTTWPSGTTLSLVYADGTTWAATITGADAAWDVDKATADTIPDGTAVKLRYVNGATDDIWAIGTVVRRG